MRPSKLRFPDSTETTARSWSCTACEIASGRGPELPMHVVQPYPTRLKPSSSSGSVRPELSRYSVTTLEPGASEVFTHGFERRPRATALRARMPAPTITEGLDVFVQLVIAAMTTCPWSSSKLSPSRLTRAPARAGGAVAVAASGRGSWGELGAGGGACPGAPSAGGSEAG